MWRLYAYPIVILVVWLICKYPHVFFGAIDKLDVAVRRIVAKILE